MTERTELQAIDPDTAGVIARPPLLFLAALLLGFVLDHLSPFAWLLDGWLFPNPVPRAGLAHRLIAAVPILAGLGLALAGIGNLARAGTPVPTSKPTRTLLTTGIHGWTRNPIYLGFFLVYIGIGVAVRSPSILMLTVPLALVVHHGVVLREEAYLERRFGDAYRRYKASVRRWL